MIYITTYHLVLLLTMVLLLGALLGTYIQAWVVRLYHHYFTPTPLRELPPVVREHIEYDLRPWV